MDTIKYSKKTDMILELVDGESFFLTQKEFDACVIYKEFLYIPKTGEYINRKLIARMVPKLKWDKDRFAEEVKFRSHLHDHTCMEELEE